AFAAVKHSSLFRGLDGPRKHGVAASMLSRPISAVEVGKPLLAARHATRPLQAYHLPQAIDQRWLGTTILTQIDGDGSFLFVEVNVNAIAFPHPPIECRLRRITNGHPLVLVVY